MLFRHTLKSPAWKALSVGARATFVALQANHNSNAQNAVFISARTGAKELGVNKDTVGKWLRELEHYGFIGKVRGAHLGSEGCGKAALYRLTDRWFAGEAPTYDFQNWSGDLFDEKQNPVRKTRTPRPKKPDIRANPRRGLNGQKRPTPSDIRDTGECPTEPDVTSFTSSFESEAGKVVPLRPVLQTPPEHWSTPVITEVLGAERDELLKILAQIPIPIPGKLAAISGKSAQ